MTAKHETIVQWTKIVLLTAILSLAVWSFGNRPPIAEAQLAASSGFSYTHTTAATNNQIATASVILHTITVNTAAGIVTIKDTTASDCSGGATIGITGTLATVGQTITYDVQTKNGLCLVTSGAADLTVSWR